MEDIRLRLRALAGLRDAVLEHHVLERARGRETRERRERAARAVGDAKRRGLDKRIVMK